jgi:predicted DNA-binding protein YlxM (UPF0122 family)
VANNIEISMLLDLYGEALTTKQRDYLCFYYNDDLSLSEIAENEGITRQGVRDAIKRAEAVLYDMESKLKFSQKIEKMQAGLENIVKYAEDINEYNLNHGLSREINDITVKIKSIALSLAE